MSGKRYKALHRGGWCLGSDTKRYTEVGGDWEAIQSVTRRWVVSGKRYKALHGGGWCLGSDTKRYTEVGGVLVIVV